MPDKQSRTRWQTTAGTVLYVSVYVLFASPRCFSCQRTHFRNVAIILSGLPFSFNFTPCGFGLLIPLYYFINWKRNVVWRSVWDEQVTKATLFLESRTFQERETGLRKVRLGARGTEMTSGDRSGLRVRRGMGMHHETENRGAESGVCRALPGASWIALPGSGVWEALRNYWEIENTVVWKGFRKGVEISIKLNVKAKPHIF